MVLVDLKPTRALAPTSQPVGPTIEPPVRVAGKPAADDAGRPSLDALG